MVGIGPCYFNDTAVMLSTLDRSRYVTFCVNLLQISKKLILKVMNGFHKMSNAV